MAHLYHCSTGHHRACRGELPHTAVACSCKCHDRRVEQPLDL